jgi:hypothetical protein
VFYAHKYVMYASVAQTARFSKIKFSLNLCTLYSQTDVQVSHTVKQNLENHERIAAQHYRVGTSQ